MNIQMFIPQVANTAVVKCLCSSFSLQLIQPRLERKRGDKKIGLPRDGTHSRYKNDEKPSLPNHMRQTSVIDIILLIFFSGGAETVLECVKVSNFTDKGAGCGDAETYPETPDGSDEDCDDLGSLWSV